MFWNLYAVVYDTLGNLRPYRNLMADLAAGLAPLEDGGILDAGCGTGNVAREVERRYPEADVVAVDASPVMLRRARGKLRRARVEQADLAAPLPFEDGVFAAVTCSNVLYSLPDPAATLRELRRVLHPGGRLALANPTPTFSMPALLGAHLRSLRSPGEALGFLLLVPSLVMATLFNLVLLWGVDRSKLHFLEPSALERLFAEAGFDEVEIRPCYAGQGWLVRARRSEPVGVANRAG